MLCTNLSIFTARYIDSKALASTISGLKWKSPFQKPEVAQECYKKAAAWYLAAYKYVEEGSIKLLSFPWCVSEVGRQSPTTH